MAASRLLIVSVSRQRGDGTAETLQFEEGVNVLVGEGNTGKTKWLQTIDYLLGDEVTAEEREDPENALFTLFVSASAVLRVNEEEISVERRWREAGSLSKIYVNGEAQNVRDFCRNLMERLGMPILHYPQGNPYGPRKWPELTWRTLFRHMYRRETMWSDLADAQPEVDQHAALMLFLGAAEKLFSQDYSDLVVKSKRILDLQARKDQFMSLLDQVSKELVDVNEIGVALTPESIEAAQAKITEELQSIERKRRSLLVGIRQGAQSALAHQKADVPDIENLSQWLVDMQNEQEEVARAIARIDSRITEVRTMHQLVKDEVAKLLRAKEAGSVLADLRVTHCPACDQELEKHGDEDSCYVCGRHVRSPGDTSSATKRIEFETEQLHSELEETEQLQLELTDDLQAKREQHKELTRTIAEITATLRPVRQAAAAVLPPELFLLDVGYGRAQEKRQQLIRIRTVLDQREQLAADIFKTQKEIAEIESAVDDKTSQIDFESMGDRLRDGMVTYFNRIVELNPKSWLGNTVSVRFGERTVRLRAGESGWKAKLGGTQRLYFLFAYHYALLNLTRFEGTLYPGFAMIDFPASLEDRAAIADKENFILEPFVELLNREDMKGCQLLAAGRSFKELAGVHPLEFNEVWK
jgi:hypothetical protein